MNPMLMGSLVSRQQPFKFNVCKLTTIQIDFGGFLMLLLERLRYLRWFKYDIDVDSLSTFAS